MLDKFVVFLLCMLCSSASALRLGTHTKLMMLGSGFHEPLSSRPPLKVLLVVEPTPFNYVCGYANRFKEMLRNLRTAGDMVEVVTPDPDPLHPTEYLGYPITSPKGFSFPLYKQVTLSLDFARNIPKIISRFKPDLVHVSSPSLLLLPTVLWTCLLRTPLVMSYHTDIAAYAKTYFPSTPRIMEAVAHWLIRTVHSFADLTLCTSPQLQKDLQALGVKRVDVWQKGINTNVFSPKYRCAETRRRLSDGHEQSPLLLYVGRLGVEKKLHRLKAVLEMNPACRLVVVGQGPAEEGLRGLFRGLPVHFPGQLVGEELSRAFASCDLFVMPSDTETLGFVVMEALASGLPSVGVRAGGLVDIIEHENTGFLVENDERMVEFSAQVARLVDDAALRGNMSAAAVAWAQGWSWEAATSKLRNVQYRKALQLFQARMRHGRHVSELEDAIMRHDGSDGGAAAAFAEKNAQC